MAEGKMSEKLIRSRHCKEGVYLYLLQAVAEKDPFGSVCCSGGQLVYYQQCLWYDICNPADPDGAVSGILPVLSVYEHTDAGYSAGT